MAHKEVRMLIPEILFIKFKVICVKKKLSVPKQTAELIRKFVEIMENSTKENI